MRKWALKSAFRLMFAGREAGPGEISFPRLELDKGNNKG